MYNIIPLIIISLSLFAILFIITRKFPALASLDVENMPAEKEARFKEQIAESRLKRSMAKWSALAIKIFKFIGNVVARLFKWAFDKLHEIKKEYNKEEGKITPEEKETKIKELFFKIENFDDKEDFEEKEASLIKIIELDSKNIEAFNNLGELYFINKKHEEAKQALVHSLKILPDEEIEKQADIYFTLSLVYKETGENKEALETIKMAAKLMPNNPKYLDEMLEISLINKDKIIANSVLKKLEEVNPENGKLAEFKEKIAQL